MLRNSVVRFLGIGPVPGALEAVEYVPADLCPARSLCDSPGSGKLMCLAEKYLPESNTTDSCEYTYTHIQSSDCSSQFIN